MQGKKKYCLISRLHSKKSNLKKKIILTLFFIFAVWLSLNEDCMPHFSRFLLKEMPKPVKSFFYDFIFLSGQISHKLKWIQLFRSDNSRILLPLFCLFFLCVKLLISSIVSKAPLYYICLDSSIPFLSSFSVN